MIKQYLQTNRSEKKYLDQWQTALSFIKKNLVTYSGDLRYLMQTEEIGGSGLEEIEHLSCYFSGTVTLGLDRSSPTYDEDLQLAIDLAQTSYELYRRTPTGIGAEITVPHDNNLEPKIKAYHLRPEAVESFFYLWKHTKDEKWRNYGWKVFQSIEKHCRVETGGYASLRDVMTGEKQDEMESFWLVIFSFLNRFLSHVKLMLILC